MPSAEILVYGFFAVLLLMAIGSWLHAKSVTPAEEYYAEELAQIEEERDDE